MNDGIKAIIATITNAIMYGNAHIKRNIAIVIRIIIRNVDMFCSPFNFVLVIVFSSIIYIKLKTYFVSFLRKNMKKVKKVYSSWIQPLNKHKKNREQHICNTVFRRTK